jgi:hypothetical protein
MKFKTCKYNANRHASKIAMPFCTYKLAEKIPPHLGWKQFEQLTEELCENCACYEKEGE